MSPLPNTRTVPRGWSKHHAPAARGAMNATVTVTDPRRATPGAFDPETGSRGAATPFVVVAGADARVQEIDASRAGNLGEQPVGVRLYLVQLPMTCPAVHLDYIVTVTACANDAHLVGRPLVVKDVQYGSERFTRDLVCSDTVQAG